MLKFPIKNGCVQNIWSKSPLISVKEVFSGVHPPKSQWPQEGDRIGGVFIELSTRSRPSSSSETSVASAAGSLAFPPWEFSEMDFPWVVGVSSAPCDLASVLAALDLTERRFFSRVCQWFFIWLSVLPGRCFAIADHLGHTKFFFFKFRNKIIKSVQMIDKNHLDP